MLFKKKISGLCVGIGLMLSFSHVSANVLSPTQSVDSPFSAKVALVTAAESTTEITPVLTIPETHQGKKANIYAISIDNTGFQYIKTDTGWDQFEGKVSTYKTVTLEDKLSLDIVSGTFCETSSGRIFYGYALEEKPNVFHGNGMSYSVSKTAQAIQTALDNIIADEETDGKIPGVVLGLEIPGEGRLYASAGVTDLSTNEPMDPHDRFRVGSISKTFTAAGVLKLVDEGKLALNDTFENLVPGLGVVNSESMQVKNLLSHTSGLIDYAFHDDWWQGLMLEEDDRTYTPTQLIEMSNQAREVLLSFGLPVEALVDFGVFQPGAVDDDGNPVVHYSNTNYGALGMVLESASGNSLEDELKSRILTPLGLDNTVIPVGNETSMPPGSATGHNNWVAQGFPLSGSDTLTIAPYQTCNFGECKDELIPQPLVESSFSWGIGNIVSNTEDLMDWITALVKREVYSYDTEKEVFNFLEINSTNEIGLGIALFYENMIGHRGQLPGFDAVMEYDMDLDIPIVASINRSFWGGRNVNEIIVLPVREILTAAASASSVNSLSQRHAPLPKILQQKADEYPGI